MMFDEQSCCFVFAGGQREGRRNLLLKRRSLKGTTGRLVPTCANYLSLQLFPRGVLLSRKSLDLGANRRVRTVVEMTGFTVCL